MGQAVAQEGCRRGDQKETYTPHPEVPACHCWCIPHRYYGKEKYEARSQEGSEGTSYQGRQGEGKGSQGSQGCPSGQEARYLGEICSNSQETDGCPSHTRRTCPASLSLKPIN